jgi:hypothetical protein
MRQAVFQEIDVETIAIGCVFVGRKKIKKQRADTESLDLAGNKAVSLTESAAAAAVRKDDDTAKAGWKLQISFEDYRSCRDADFFTA